MKFFRNDICYVHWYDLARLYGMGQAVPTCVANQVAGTIVTATNQFSLMRFDQPEQVRFMHALDWILDFDKLSEMSTQELKHRRAILIKRRDKMYAHFNSHPVAGAAYDQTMYDGLAMFHKVGTITKFLKWRSGRLKLELPPVRTFKNPS